MPTKAESASDRTNLRKCYFSGTHRIWTPTETLAKVTPLMAAAGITRIANLTGLDRIGIPVVSVTRPNARSLSVSQGKGLDLDAAKASGIMEAMESYHAENIEHPLRLTSENALKAQAEITALTSLPRLKGAFPDPWAQILWIEGTELLTNLPIWIPYEIVHTNYTLPAKAESGCLVASSNGLASGNSLAEAVVHAIAEVVERDANTIWNLLPDDKIAESRLDLLSVTDFACRSLLNKLDAAGMTTAVWDISSDVGLPAFHCLILDQRRPNGHSGAGAGCHPSAEIALSRAITEAVQVRCNYIAGARDDLLPQEYAPESLDEKKAWAERLMALPTRNARSFGSIASWRNDSVQEDLEMMLAKLSEAGLNQVVCVDLSKPDFNVAVVRIIIPGLEGPDDHPDFTPGNRAASLRGKPA